MIETGLTSVYTRYLDWFFVLVLLAMAWLAFRLAREDFARVSKRELTGRLISLPLFIVAASLVVAALGTAIGGDYWELRAFVLVFVLWAISFMLYAGLLHLSQPQQDDNAGRGVVLIGLILISLSLLLPGLLGKVSQKVVNTTSHGWYLLVAVSVACILAGLFQGHARLFPKFAAGLGILILAGWGFTELFFARPSFPWLIRAWNLSLPGDYVASFSEDPAWRVYGAIKVLVGAAALVFLFIINSPRRSDRGPHGE